MEHQSSTYGTLDLDEITVEHSVLWAAQPWGRAGRAHNIFALLNITIDYLIGEFRVGSGDLPT